MRKLLSQRVPGFHDYSHSYMRALEKVISLIQGVFTSFGFSPLATPALEYKEILLGHLGEDKEIFLFSTPQGEEVGLRFDLTLPLARFIATNKNTINFPFKRYQLEYVWRYDKPDPTRYREFLQFDVDTVGVVSPIADAEIIQMNYEIFLKLVGKNQFRIRLNNRKLLSALISSILGEKNKDLEKKILRIIDKKDRYGKEAVIQELTSGRRDSSGAFIPGLGLNKEVKKIMEFLELPTGNLEILKVAKKFWLGDPLAKEGEEELAYIYNFLKEVGVGDELLLDLTLVRGLDYYTGTIFEITLENLPRFGSVLGGGRFDSLLQKFVGEDIPACGASIGISRLMNALFELNLVKESSAVADVLISVMVPERMKDYYNIAQNLRQAGINTMLYLPGSSSLKKQLQYADRGNIPLVLIIGEEEFNKSSVAIKDLRIGKEKAEDIKDRETWLKERPGQINVPLASLIGELKKALSKGNERK